MMANHAFNKAFLDYLEGQISESEFTAFMQNIATISDSTLEETLRDNWLKFDKPEAAILESKGKKLLQAILEREVDERNIMGNLGVLTGSIIMEPTPNDPEFPPLELPAIKDKGAITYLRRWWLAASIITAIFIGGYLWLNNQKVTYNNDNQQIAIIPPGREGAILTLSNGSQVLLDSVQNGIIAQQGGATAKVVNGVLIYDGMGNEPLYNTTRTPIGRQYNLTLPDGSKVWLNAASSIRYPTVFEGKERMVEVSGEVYFEVARNTKQPFKVNIAGKAVVEVLGTAFNVNAYDNEQNIQTTLLEGAVRVKSNGSDGVVLAPGQQAALTYDGKFSVLKNIRIDQVIAWKSGVFNLNGLSLDAIMRQVERWYDIQVIYEKGIPAIQFGGEMGRGVSLNDLLKFMEGSKLRFRLEGKQLIIMQ